jgi:hypothetical protein
MLAAAEDLRRLHVSIHETFKTRDRSPQDREVWKRACAEFHSRYDALAFPGGYDGAPERIAAGDAAAIETALCFLECRPYFFRSGYMFKKLLRRVKQAPLSKSQAARLQAVIQRQRAWRERNRATDNTAR